MEPIRLGMPAASVARVVAELFGTVAREFAVILLDPELRIASWNAGAQHLFGHAAHEVLGEPTDLIFTPEDRQRRVPQHEAAIARAAGRAHDDRWHARKDGSRFWASGLMLALRDGEGAIAGYAKLMRDRTDLQTEIVTLKNRLDDELDERQRRTIMLGTLAHELRNPLAPLANASRLIRLTAADERLDAPLQIIERQIAFLQRLIDDLLDTTRIGAGKLRLEVGRFVLQDALADAIDGVRDDAVARRQRLQAVLPPAPIEIDADRDRVVQIFVNLLANAVRYTPPGGQIWLKASLESAHALIRVEDDGEGIAPELQPRIFELFTQGHAGAGRGSGLGIGLALVKDLVAAHGGTVAVRSEGPGKGSEFTVRLPLARAPLAAA